MSKRLRHSSSTNGNEIAGIWPRSGKDVQVKGVQVYTSVCVGSCKDEGESIVKPLSYIAWNETTEAERVPSGKAVGLLSGIE